MALRPYQVDIVQRLQDAWVRGVRVPCAVLPTGAGKTVVFSHILHQQTKPCAAIAHRQELVGQISMALARNGVRHRLITSDATRREIISLQVAELKGNYVSHDAPVGVIGVDSFTKPNATVRAWAESCELWVLDEAHHLLRDNKWGKAVQYFSNARGLCVTATPCRSDGRGLGSHADGLIDELIVGPSMRDLISMGYLTDYRIFAPDSHLNLDAVAISSATGDYNQSGLRTAMHEARLHGDVVAHYKRVAMGKLGITFATDVETATELAAAYNAAGVPAAVISAKSTPTERITLLRKFRNRQILQLVNVDLFGEGFDLPALEVVSMARPTMSYSLYTQQFGRSLRILEGKTEAIILDHVGNVLRHGLPDMRTTWTLDRRDRKQREAEVAPIALKACVACTAVYERFRKECPYCGHVPVPAERGSIKQVDGDLRELDLSVLRAMRSQVDHIDMPVPEYNVWCARKGMPDIGRLAAVKRHRVDQAAQGELREAMRAWGEMQPYDVVETQKLFYLTFGVDVLSAQGLTSKDALELNRRVSDDISRMG